MKLVQPILKETYLAVIKNSLGARVWRDNFVLVSGKQKNATQKGQLSCAFFVSSILKMFDLINDLHLTVAGTEADLKKAGWQISSKLRPGAVIVWQKIKTKNGLHGHLGFCLDSKKAISHLDKKGSPQIHDLFFKKMTRKIERIYWHPKLDR